MKPIALLISPEAKSAYFKDYLDVAKQELKTVFGDIDVAYKCIGSLDFFHISCAEDDLQRLTRLSFVQGLFSVENEKYIPLDLSGDFPLHADFVFGSKYRGKTNERLTQLLINIGLSSIDATDSSKVKLLDPMCGRATTLLWAMRYGIKAKGIEQDAQALAEIRQSLKKWTKLHRQKHQLKEGFTGKANKKDLGKFLEFNAEGSSMKVIVGDAINANDILKGERFDLIVSDLPYGIQHFTTSNTRNPLAVLKECLPQWKASLKPGGAIVLAFNSYIPKRAELISAFAEQGLAAQDFSIPHRMSESIVRDVVVFKLP
ncbi:MAG: hypothetical protein HRU20_09865 [Pseudomonadales bacterium]|nr:hypothetical protein [Pseudomonadales bacterium]